MMLTSTADIAEFWSRVDKTGDCWLWTGYRFTEGRQKGYGQFKRNLRAHRVSYELSIGPIPEGLVLDHLCRNPSCVRPEHLEPVSNYVNVVERGQNPFAINARKTHCTHGHEFTPENTWLRSDGSRTCRACRRERMRRYHAAQGAGLAENVTPSGDSRE